MTYLPSAPPAEQENEHVYPVLNQISPPGQTAGNVPNDNINKNKPVNNEYKGSTDYGGAEGEGPNPGASAPEEEYQMAVGLSIDIDYQTLLSFNLMQPEGQLTDPRSMKDTDIPSFIPYIRTDNSDILSLCQNIKNSLGVFKSKKGKMIAFTNAILHTNKEERQQLNSTYIELYKTNLIRIIRRTFTGVFREILLYLMMPKIEFIVKWIDIALLQKDVILLSMILCTQTNENLNAIKEAFKKKHTTTTLSRKVDKATTKWGLHKRNINALLMNIINNGRASDLLDVNRDSVLNDVKLLINATQGKMDKQAFISIFSLRSFQHLSMVAAEYENIQKENQQSLLEVIEQSFKKSSETGNACKTILYYSTRRYELFSNLLVKCVKQPGPNYAMFLRMIVERCDIDLGNIIQIYGDKKLKEWINARFVKDVQTCKILNKICGF